MMLQLIDMFQHHGKTSGGWGNARCSDRDHLLSCGQTVAPMGPVITTLQCNRGRSRISL